MMPLILPNAEDAEAEERDRKFAAEMVALWDDFLTAMADDSLRAHRAGEPSFEERDPC